MRMRRLPGGRFEVSLKYDHQHGRVIYFFVHALSEFKIIRIDLKHLIQVIRVLMKMMIWMMIIQAKIDVMFLEEREEDEEDWVDVEGGQLGV
ncbi:unnamed protein product [Meloidogyne enterolobii]|uniref:Uncharacterized protein n=1 Tax=Meloidogyne enterolobii TaxID=390850 RepID=A0ACB0YWC6_MELEN